MGTLTLSLGESQTSTVNLRVGRELFWGEHWRSGWAGGVKLQPWEFETNWRFAAANKNLCNWNFLLVNICAQWRAEFTPIRWFNTIFSFFLSDSLLTNLFLCWILGSSSLYYVFTLPFLFCMLAFVTSYVLTTFTLHLLGFLLPTYPASTWTFPCQSFSCSYV